MEKKDRSKPNAFGCPASCFAFWKLAIVCLPSIRRFTATFIFIFLHVLTEFYLLLRTRKYTHKFDILGVWHGTVFLPHSFSFA